MFKRILTLAVAFLVLAGPITNPTLGLTEQDTASDADHPLFAHDPMFDSVVSTWSLINGEWYPGTGFYLGNGWFGGTGHQGDGATQMRLFSGRDSWNYEHMWTVDDIDIHEEYTGVTGTGKDFAMFHVSGVVDLEPIQRSYIPPERGMEYAFAGFGMYGTASNPNQGYDYLMRAGRNRADFFGGDSPFLNVESQYMLAEFDPPGYAALPLEAHVASSNSGSLVNGSLGGQWLATAFMVGHRGGYGYFDQTILLPFTEVNDFIDARVPEPSTLGFLLVGMLLVGRRRVRH